MILGIVKSVIRIVVIVVLATLVLSFLGINPLVEASEDESDKLAEYTDGSWDELGMDESRVTRAGHLELPRTNHTNTFEFHSERLDNNSDSYTVFVDYEQKWDNRAIIHSYVADDNLSRDSNASVSQDSADDVDRYVFSDSEYYADETHETVEFRFSINYSTRSLIDSITIYEGDVAMSEYEDSREDDSHESEETEPEPETEPVENESEEDTVDLTTVLDNSGQSHIDILNNNGIVHTTLAQHTF